MITAAFLTGCAQIDEEAYVSEGGTIGGDSAYPAEVNGVVFDASPLTAASLSPALTEIIYELGYGGALTGTSVYCVSPEGVSQTERIGSAANPDIGAIIRLNPDLLLSQSPIAKKDISLIEESGTRVLILDAPATVDGLFELYRDVSVIFEGKTNAASVAENALKPLRTALAGAKDSAGSFVYILDDKLSVAPPDTFIGDFFSCFGKNAVYENGKLNLTVDELMELSPDYLFASAPFAEDGYYSLLGINEQNYNIIVLSAEAVERLERPSSRLYGVVSEITEKIGNSKRENSLRESQTT
jgi:iron complex transport system substrate-binding protein